MAKKAKRNIADEAMKKVVAEALKSEKLVRRMLKTIEGDPKLRARFTSIVGEQLAKQVLAEPRLPYYGPPNNEFPSGGRTRYEFYMAHGATKRIASGLNTLQITPYELFVMSDEEILGTDGLGPATADYATELRKELSKSPTK
ncbi:MAG: hypothetical protein QG639_506 [Patescibacteria group bacterium]|jgi:hypothetical protein|nr:hypothetical protein [Patescibacteria group bacterium]